MKKNHKNAKDMTEYTNANLQYREQARVDALRCSSAPFCTLAAAQ
jgi:hypothetical protein